MQSRARMAIVHFTQATSGRRAIARDEAERRRILTALARTGGSRLLLFSLVDDHLHTALSGDRLGLLARDLRWVLRRYRPDLALDPAHVKPVETRSHLTWLVAYLLRQPEKHGLAGVHPAIYGGSCLQDLVGARLLTGFSPGLLRAELPRLTQRELLPMVGLTEDRLAPASDEDLRRGGVARLVDLAAATLAVAPDFRGRDAVTVRARVLAARLSNHLEFAAREVGRLLQVTLRAVHRFANDRDEDPRAENALRLRSSLEDRALGRIERAG
jgi:hypothetical protein